MNYIRITPEENKLRVQMYINNEPTSWIMFDHEQAENLLKTVAEEVKRFRKTKRKSCKSKNTDNMCNFCDCWKHTRHMCS